MSSFPSEYQARPPYTEPDEWQRRAPVAGWERSRRGESGLLIAGLVAAGLGALAWYYLGPDLRRYLKLRNM